MPRHDAEAKLLRMAASLQHESWYARGTWIEESLGLYVAWVERDAMRADCMPIESEDRNTVLAFSGEDFSDSGVAHHYQGNGNGHDPTERSYLADVPAESSEFPKCLNGRFHGVLADRKRGTAMLFNDRYGLHRLYYHEAKGAFYFAAEAKAIRAVCPELKSIDADGLAEFISCGCTLDNRTLFKYIKVLPPGSAWTFLRKTLDRKRVYFDPQEWEGQPQLEPEPYYQRLREVFSTKLPRYFKGPQPIAISLTGGLDSRMIMSWMNAAPGALPCYSFGGMYRDSQDVLIARRVANACGQQHQVIPVGDHFLAQFPRYAERAVYLTDGCADVRHAPDLYINERAREIAPVRMTGNYGSEILRGVRAFKPVEPVSGLFTSEFSAHLERAKATYSSIAAGHPVAFAAFRQAPWSQYGLLCLEQSQLTLRSPFLDNELVQTAFQAPQSVQCDEAVSLRLIADGNRVLRKIRTDRGVGGSLPAWMAAIQRAHFAFTFKAEYAYDYGMPQSVARFDHALSRFHLERLFLGRHKFCHFRVWYRDTLSSYVREILLDSRTLSRSYLTRRVLENSVQEHLSGRRNYTATIHKLLSLELFYRLFID